VFVIGIFKYKFLQQVTRLARERTIRLNIRSSLRAQIQLQLASIAFHEMMT
jgi:hypothetical protein